MGGGEEQSSKCWERNREERIRGAGEKGGHERNAGFVGGTGSVKRRGRGICKKKRVRKGEHEKSIIESKNFELGYEAGGREKRKGKVGCK